MFCNEKHTSRTGCKKKQIPYQVIHSKKVLIEEINKTDFNILVSNGCRYILPVSKLPNKKYINFHPSCLPDLKGIDPAIGAILFQRDGGATCHIMNDNIDAGDIISQVKIPYTKDIDVCLMYQLSFIAEKKCFHLAYARNFEPLKAQEADDNAIYYSRTQEDVH